MHPSANIASFDHGDGSYDNSWYPDSGATNYVTFDLNNLNIGSKYKGAERVQMRNGAGLIISNFGSSTLTTLDKHSSHSFLLNNLLHVPNIIKNLMSVSQFAKDNDVFFEFHPTFCFVKDQTTHKILLQGALGNRLYKFQLAHYKNHHPNHLKVI